IPASRHACGVSFPLAIATSICRKRATICSGVCFFRAIFQLLSYQIFSHFTWYKTRRSRQGDEAELRVIHDIYSMFLEGDMSVTQIMRHLNRTNIPREVPWPWNHGSVQRILTHPKYLGCIVFNRSSSRLHTKKVAHTPEKWVLNPKRFPA